MCIISSLLLREWNFLFDLTDDISFIALRVHTEDFWSIQAAVKSINTSFGSELMGQELPLCPIDGLFQSTEVKQASFPIFASLDMEVGRPFLCLREASTPPPPPPPPLPIPCLQGEPGQMGSVFDKEPLHPCFNALLLHFKSSTVFSKCWTWQLCQSLATLNNPPFKSGSPNPDSVESCDGAHRGRPLCPPLCGG